MAAVLAWFMANWGMIAGVLLAISEALHIAFPADSGFGGFINGAIQFLKGIGAKDSSGS